MPDWLLAFPLMAKEAEQDQIDLHDAGQIVWREWPTTNGLIVNDHGQVACKSLPEHPRPPPVGRDHVLDLRLRGTGIHFD